MSTRDPFKERPGYRAVFLAWIAPAVRPARPWLRVTVSPRVARFLVAAGVRVGPHEESR